MAGLGPVFLLQVVDVQSPHHVVLSRFQAGGKIEADLIKGIVDAAKSKGVGIFRTEAQVAAAIDSACREVFAGLTSQTRGMVPPFKQIKHT